VATLDDITRERTLIRVVVTGSECTGKSTLVEALAKRYGGVAVPEYVREFVRAKGSPPEQTDVDAIGRGQIALEDQYIADNPRLLVHDTDLVSTLVYSQHYYGDCPPWIEGALRQRPADLYLLTGIDVPWVADGDQRDRGDRRGEMHQLFMQALIVRNLPVVELRGSHETRMAVAAGEIDVLL
jgi:NadR type nicotinamide-nucleotide adenylyltransferase